MLSRLNFSFLSLAISFYSAVFVTQFACHPSISQKGNSSHSELLTGYTPRPSYERQLPSIRQDRFLLPEVQRISHRVKRNLEVGPSLQYLTPRSAQMHLAINLKEVILERHGVSRENLKLILDEVLAPKSPCGTQTCSAVTGLRQETSESFLNDVYLTVKRGLIKDLDEQSTLTAIASLRPSPSALGKYLNLSNEDSQVFETNFVKFEGLIPLGFPDRKQYDSLIGNLKRQIQLQYPGTEIYFEGSSVSGRSFAKGTSFNDVTSDYDMAIIGPNILSKARSLNLMTRGGKKRSTPLNTKRQYLPGLQALGLSAALLQFERATGRSSSFMIYESYSELLKRQTPHILATGDFPAPSAQFHPCQNYGRVANQ